MRFVCSNNQLYHIYFSNTQLSPYILKLLRFQKEVSRKGNIRLISANLTLHKGMPNKLKFLSMLNRTLQLVIRRGAKQICPPRLDQSHKI